MSEQSSSPQETADSLSASPTVMQPQNQWALIRRSFRKRKLAVLSLYGIVFLITISIFAPFIANDRPITYRGVNKFEYNLSYLYLTSQLHRLTSPPKVEETTTPDKPIKKKKSIKSILLFQIDLMSTHLETTQAKELSELRQQLVSIADSGVSLEEKKADVKEFRTLLKKSFGPKMVTLQTKRYWPVISSLNGTEIAFMLFNLAMLSFPLFRWASTKYFPKQQFVVAVMVLFVIPAILGMLWWMSFPYRLDRTNYKSAVMVADAKQNPQSHVLFESSLWPPIRHGIDGYNLDAINALPGFTTSANEGSIWDTPYWFGTDGIGRDLATRMIWGGRISLAVGIVAVSIYVTIGIIVGSIAGYFGGIVDLLLSRFIEMVIVFPSFFLILTVIAFVGPSIFNIMIIIGLTGWTGVARLVRGEFLRLKAQEFVLAGRALGYSPLRIIYRHVLPNAMAPVLVSATFGIAGAILTESALSFLGLGITVPKPSWGGILSTARTTFDTAPWLTYIPGMAIFLTITAYNLVGEAFRDAADPRLRGK